MSKHTNGPWPIIDSDGTRIMIGEQRLDVPYDGAQDQGHANSFEVAQANAQLIAAAPELLEAATKAERDISDLIAAGAVHDQDAVLLRATIKALRDAVNKAEGK